MAKKDDIPFIRRAKPQSVDNDDGDLKKSSPSNDTVASDKPSSSPTSPEETLEKGASMGKKLKRAQLVGQAAYGGAKVGIFLKMAQFLKMMMSAMAQGASMAISGVAGFIGNIAYIAGLIGQAIASAVVGAVGAVASALGATVGVASAIVGGIATVAMTGILGIGLLVFGNDPGQTDGLPANCVDAVLAVQAEVDSSTDGQQTLHNAQAIYSVFHAYGLSDNSIAGIIGNFATESGIDPTGIEGIYDERHTLGPRKMAAIRNPNKHAEWLFASYRKAKVPHAPSAYMNERGDYVVGFGLPQYTPGSILTDPANALGYNWYDLNFQLAFILGTGTQTTTKMKGGRNFFNIYKEETKNMTPGEAALYFTQYYEGNTVNGQKSRVEGAEKWAKQIAMWTPDSEYASSVLELATLLGMQASDGAVANELDNCQTFMNYDNSSIALAAASYAYPTSEMGKLNDGTPLYRRVHDYVAPGDTLYQSCDRTVAVAVRWAGVDDTYPMGGTSNQLAYLRASTRWKHIGGAGSLTIMDLLPGDVFIVPGHTFMYVSPPVLQSVHGGAVNIFSDSVSGSFHERSPGADSSTSSILRRNGQDWQGRGEYQVYRMVDPQNSPKFKNAGAGANP